MGVREGFTVLMAVCSPRGEDSQCVWQPEL